MGGYDRTNEVPSFTGMVPADREIMAHFGSTTRKVTDLGIDAEKLSMDGVVEVGSDRIFDRAWG